MAINAGNVYSELILNGDKYFGTLDKADKETKSFENKLKGYGKDFEKAGKGLMVGVTTPIVGLGTVATKTAIDFESAFAGVIKTVDATDEQLAKLETGIRDMSKEIPASATAIAGVAEAAGQLGIETDNILGFTRVMIDLGEATNLSADDAATALARLANITGMSQQDFDRLGSTIVDLGNNLATTEAEIVAMGLRLAGAGSQIGLSEAQIMSFAGALSSVGIEAEAGGSAFSKVMIDIQLAVETNSNRLKEFADVAGMSGEEFRKAFKEDAAGAIITFIQGLGNAEKRGLSAIKVLDDMGISEIRLRDALLRASGASEVFADSLDIGTKAWEENTALTKEAEQRYKTTASQIEIAKNYLKDAGITIGEIVVPHIVSLAEGVKKASEWFSKLNPETQESIVKMAGLAAAIGPVLFVGGKATSSIGSIVGVIGKLSGGATAAATATTAMSSGIGAAGLAAKAGALLFNPWTLGIAAAGVGAIALAKHLKEDAIPAVNLFSEETSESTKLVVSSFLELEKEATILINKLAWSSSEVTDEMKDDLVGKFDTMKNEIVDKLKEQKESALVELNEMFANSKTISEEEKDEMIRIAGEKYDELITETEIGNARIKEILEKAKEENRTITEEERKEIYEIKEGMKEDAITLLSETEVESLAILERLKAESGNITARMAADVVKNSIEQKEKAVAEAEQEYQERLKYAATLRAQGSEESEKLANKVVEEAKRQRDEAVAAAEDMHERVVTEAKNQAKEHVNEIDWEIGEIKTKWQQFAEWASRNVVKQQVTVETNYVQSRMNPGIPTTQANSYRIPQNAHGTNFFGGGLTWVGEQGPELIELPKSTKIHSNQKSMEMIKGQSVINNNFKISKMEVRNDNDINRIAQELHNLQQQKSRGRGIKEW